MDYQRLVSYIYSYPEGVKGEKCRICKGIGASGAVQVKHQLKRR